VASTNYEDRYFGVTAHDGRIYVLSDNGFEVYVPETDQWTTLRSLNDYRGKSLVSMNDQLWSLGGGGMDPATKSIFSYNISSKSWASQPDMNAERMWHSSFVVNH